MLHDGQKKKKKKFVIGRQDQGREKFWMPPPWKCSRPGWMELWETWSSGRCHCPWRGGWDKMIFKVSSNPYHFMILWFYDAISFIIAIQLRSLLQVRFENQYLISFLKINYGKRTLMHLQKTLTRSPQNCHCATDLILDQYFWDSPEHMKEGYDSPLSYLLTDPMKTKCRGECAHCYVCITKYL